MGPIPVVVVGVGKIARDQHLPAIAANPRFRLVAAVSRNGTVDGVPNFTGIDDYLARGPAGAIALCTPPDVRLEMALAAVAAGRDLLIEKPPASTLGEIDTIIAAARAAGTVLFATWHSRFAPGVGAARDWVAGRRLTGVEIVWREDVRRWHPGQDWIWRPGGFGVFDPGINALSILTAILPDPVLVRAATMEVPDGAATPIAARLDLAAGDVPVTADFDWRQEGAQTWDIRLTARDGTLRLSEGGARLAIDGRPVEVGAPREYPAIYERFADLIDRRESDADTEPLRIVADAGLKGRQVGAERFEP